ncbi:MAG: hypothetical protein GW939_04510, partial [Candidatus Magasanikbacteria bacterium]|nr:hypothetical protein [Candidatus Magasanikbacteria bacterium]
MKKILYVNGGMKKFGDDFRNICSQSKIDCISFRAGINMAIHIENSKVDLYVDNNLINFDEIGYSFIRVKGKYTQPTALLSTLLKLKGIPFNDSSNTENTFNDEKVMQMLLFGHAGIPIPRTTIFTKESFEMNEKIILSKHTFPVVLKTSGSKGNAVWRVEKIED